MLVIACRKEEGLSKFGRDLINSRELFVAETILPFQIRQHASIIRMEFVQLSDQFRDSSLAEIDSPDLGTRPFGAIEIASFVRPHVYYTFPLAPLRGLPFICEIPTGSEVIVRQKVLDSEGLLRFGR